MTVPEGCESPGTLYEPWDPSTTLKMTVLGRALLLQLLIAPTHSVWSFKTKTGFACIRQNLFLIIAWYHDTHRLLPLYLFENRRFHPVKKQYQKVRSKMA